MVHNASLRTALGQTTTFLTGGTGFLGQYLLAELLRRGQRVVVLLRGPIAASRARLVRILHGLDLAIEPYLTDGRLIIVEGALPDDLPPVTAVRIDQIVHCAACLQLDNDETGEPFATNVDGAKALAVWADRHDVPRMHFVSTAYTCGREAVQAREVFHSPRPLFVTDYELSKWLAEEHLLAWSRRSGRLLTVLRPGLVIGDSRSGFTTQYGGFYQLAHMIEVLKTYFQESPGAGGVELPIRIPARPNDVQNLVPVDYVTQAIAAIVTRRDLPHCIYHITHPGPPTNQEVKSWLDEYYQVRGTYFVDRVDGESGASLAESMFFKMNDLVFKQFLFAPDFDCKNTLSVLAATNIVCPTLDQAAAFRLLDYARAHQWGSRSRAVAS